jgi:hypothetical protein
MGSDTIKQYDDEAELKEITRLYNSWEPEWQASANTTSNPVVQAGIGYALLALRLAILAVRVRVEANE